MGKVIIEKLDCFGRHGVLKEENILGQRFFVSCEMETDFESPALNDDISLAVNYAEVASFITKYVKNNVFKLIETLSVKLANEILINFKVKKVTVKIEKPSAPVGLPLKTVAVETTVKWNKAYLSIGSNFVTEPYGYTEQDEFLNGCIEIETIYSPHSLLKVVNKIEADADRKREIHWGPRTLDVDIVLYEDKIINDEKLNIPHIDMENRLFVLEPLTEIAPYAKNPLNNKSVRDLYKELKNKL